MDELEDEPDPPPGRPQGGGFRPATGRQDRPRTGTAAPPGSEPAPRQVRPPRGEAYYAQARSGFGPLGCLAGIAATCVFLALILLAINWGGPGPDDGSAVQTEGAAPPE